MLLIFAYFVSLLLFSHIPPLSLDGREWYQDFYLGLTIDPDLLPSRPFSIVFCYFPPSFAFIPVLLSTLPLFLLTNHPSLLLLSFVTRLLLIVATFSLSSPFHLPQRPLPILFSPSFSSRCFFQIHILSFHRPLQIYPQTFTPIRVLPK